MCMASYPWFVRRAAWNSRKALLGRHASFERSMILLQDVVHVLDRPGAAPGPQEAFLVHS